MRTRACVGVAMLMLTAFSALARGAENTWVVYSTDAVDERIERQLDLLAAHDQALIRIVKGTAEPGRAATASGGLTIELLPAKSAESFLEDLKREAGPAAIAPTAELARDGYIIEVSYPRAAAPNRLRITSSTGQGLHNALLRVPELLTLAPSKLLSELLPRPQSVRIEKNGTSAVIADFPSFPERGVVEGFYGTPWTHQDRLDILRFEGAHGMNVYYYAPKDDPYHRKLWRDAYPPEGQKQLGELARTAQHEFVDFCFAISPGLTMAYSSDHDFEVLTNKLASVGKLGVSCFALFLDDVPQDMQDPQDKAQFKTLAQAHIYLTNKLYKHLKEQSAANRLVLTPTTYTNEWGNRDYIKELGAGVDPNVPIVWTGPKVFSPAITAEQTRDWSEYLHRSPLIWDNFPVNDGARWCRYLGPLTGRDPHLAGAARGLVSNPMNEAHASMIPLETIADYLWNAAAYDPAQSETHAVVSQYGQDAPRLLAPFLRTYGTSYYWEDGIFTALFKERHQPLDLEKMQSTLAEMRSTLQRLRYQRRLQPLLEEISPAIKHTEERLAEVKADPAFKHLPDGKLAWDENYEELHAYRLTQSPNLDGDFSKWGNGPLYRLDEHAQALTGAKLWKGPQQLSARVALAWDDNFLYVGVDVTNPELTQPFFARGIQNGDTFSLNLETGFRKNFYAIEPTGDEYTLYFSPGDFADVKPSIFSDEDYLPPRPQPHNYVQEIFTAWKKTANGYSGDIAIPVTFFEGGKFAPGYELGLALSTTKVIRPARPTDREDVERVVLRSKKDRLFHTTSGNPSSYPRVVLTEGNR